MWLLVSSRCQRQSTSQLLETKKNERGLSLTLLVKKTSAVGVTATFVPFTTVAGRSVTMVEPLESVVEMRMEELTVCREAFNDLIETLFLPARIDLSAASTRAIFG